MALPISIRPTICPTSHVLKLSCVVFLGLAHLLAWTPNTEARSAADSGSQGMMAETFLDLEDEGPNNLTATVVPPTGDPFTIQCPQKRVQDLTEILGPLRRSQFKGNEHTRSLEVYRRMRVLLALLRLLTRGSPDVEILEFWNWDKTIHVDQLFYVRVSTIWEVRRVISAARHLGMQVRATGTGHSRSPLFVDEGSIMMDVRGLARHDGPRMVLNDKTGTRDFQTVTAMTGVACVDLNRFLVENGVGVMAGPIQDRDTLGGMVAASTHGSSWQGTTFSGFVVEVRLMDSMGRLRRFSKERQPALFKAVMCNLGMFGIMYDITFQVIPSFVVRVDNAFVPMKDLLTNREALQDQVTSNLLTEVSWYPFNSVGGEDAQAYEVNQTVPESWSAQNDEVWLRTIRVATADEIAGNKISGPLYLPTNGSLSGGAVTGLLRAKRALSIAKSLGQTSYHQLVHAFPLILAPSRGKETSAAFMLNVDAQFERVERALQYIVNKTEHQIRSNGSTPLNAFLPRFIKNHDCLLCPSNMDIKMPNDTGHTLVVDFLAPPTQFGFYPLAANFVEEFKSEKVRPHWAKRHDNIDGIVGHIQSVFGDNLIEFQEQRRLAKVDPCDMFTNSYLLAILGASSDCACSTPPLQSSVDMPSGKSQNIVLLVVVYLMFSWYLK